MKKKIFFLFEYKYFDKYTNFYNINFLSKYFDIYIFDFHKIFSKNFRKNIKNTFKSRKFYIITKISEFKNFIINKKPCYVVLEGSEDFKYEMSKILKPHSDAKIVEFYAGTVPEDIHHYNLYGIKKILFSFKAILFSRLILNKILIYIFNKIKSIFSIKKKFKSYFTDILFYAGDHTLKLDSIRNKKILKYVPSPSFDYDIYLKQKKLKKIFSRKKYAVFLDSMIVHHEDYRMNYKYHTVPVTLKYFNEMNKFFDKIEKHLNLEVVIALHPNCNVKNYSKFFDDRKCIKSDTARLVRDSKFIFSHASTTAINFAIIYNKPIVYIITNEMQRSYLTLKRHLIKKKIFKHNFINVSSFDPEKLKKNFIVDNSVYKSYYRNYINSCSNKNKNLGNLVLDNLK